MPTSNVTVVTGTYKLSHRSLKRLIAALAMITQRRHTYESHVDFDSFMVLCVYFDPKKF